VVHDDAGHAETANVSLYWLPLGAGGRSVRWNGRVFEAFVAHHERRRVADLYHSALEVRVGAASYTIEMTPAWGADVAERGVVKEGPVGSRWLGSSILFRYEVRCWYQGLIPDVDEAVDSPQVVSTNVVQARQLLALVALVPSLTWGRDELHAGEMWNSNSLTSWLLARSGHPMDLIAPPPHGRAPGWCAGLRLAARQRIALPTPAASFRPGAALS
jgi:hypothetical protein